MTRNQVYRFFSWTRCRCLVYNPLQRWVLISSLHICSLSWLFRWSWSRTLNAPSVWYLQLRMKKVSDVVFMFCYFSDVFVTWLGVKVFWIWMVRCIEISLFSKTIHSKLDYCTFVYVPQSNNSDVWLLDAIVRERSIDQMLSERCDGNRNILHACVAACAPSSNKDLDTGLNAFFFFCLSFHKYLIIIQCGVYVMF